MFIHIERLRGGEAPDCSEDIHDGTWKPNPAKYVIDGKRYLCQDHFDRMVPIAEIVT